LRPEETLDFVRDSVDSSEERREREDLTVSGKKLEKGSILL